VFGSKDLGDKMIAGDRQTPEGTFHIVSKKVHSKWCRFLA
jgi:murein L,D-transpeptidase YafK